VAPAGSAPAAPAPAHRLFSCAPAEDWQAAFGERFGVTPEALSGLRLVRWGKRHWCLVNHDLEVPGRLQPEALGLPAVRRQSLPLRPTTAAVMLLGRYATRNRLQLDTAALVRYRAREEFLLGVDAPALSDCTGPGLVIAEHAGHPIGLAQLIYERERPLVRVRSHYPVAWVPASAGEQPPL